ncbi:MAG: lysophospholipid acyltransferase family protein [Gammaproteobacteria bacterium]|nr:lysophospholipid acyltransferase family protein [Gammaproteobacteria bacterium]
MRSKIIVYLVRGLSVLPLGVIQRLGVFLGWLFYRISNRERKTTRINIDLCFPEYTSQQKDQLLRLSLIEGAKTLLEMPGIWHGDAERMVEQLELGDGADLPQRALEQNRGVIVAAPHLGAWEVGLHYLAQLAPTTALYRPPREKAMEEIIAKGRSKGGSRLVPTTAAGIKALYQALRRKEIVAILPDQQPRHLGKSAGVFAPFFKVPALTMVLVNRLAQRTGAIVIYTYVERLPDALGYRMHFLPAPPGMDDPDPEVGAGALNRGVEACARRCPAQYQWSYKRFSVRPDGARSPYKG